MPSFNRRGVVSSLGIGIDIAPRSIVGKIEELEAERELSRESRGR